MKKLFKSLFVVIAATATFAGCQKEENNAPATQTKTVEFFANSIETKTQFGTPEEGVYPTLWTAGDEVTVLVNLDNVANTQKQAVVECSADFKSARFEADLAQPEAELFTFYSVSPSSALKGKSGAKGYLYVEIPAGQTPLKTSVDKAAQVLYAASATTETMPSSVDLDFHHLTAYGKFSLVNLTSEVSAVSMIKIEAPEDVFVAGKWDYFVENGSFVVREGNGSNVITLTTDKTSDIWFAAAPAATSGKKIKFTVTTDKGNFVKEVTFPGNLVAGKIATFAVNMAGVEVEQPEVTETEWVATGFADLKAGDQVVIVSTKDTDIYAMTNNKGTGSAPATFDVTYANGKLTTNPGDDVIWTVSVDGENRIFHPNGDTSKWLYCTSANNGVRVGTNVNKNFVLDAETGYMKNVDTNRYLGVYNKQDWRCYTNTTGNTAGQTFQFFVKAGNGSEEPEQPKVLSSIAVSGQKTEYYVGDTFVAPTVTATYEDGKTATVTATFTGYNLSEAGEQTVMVSYTENEVTKTATYTITVSETPATKELTVAEFLSAEVSTTVWYQLTGTISNIYNENYGNFYLTDAAGDQVTVYGLKENETAGKTSFGNLGLKEGDRVTLIGNRGVYNDTPQVTNAYHVGNEKIAAWDAPQISCFNNTVTISSDENVTIFYTLDGSSPTESSLKYLESFPIDKDVTVKAIAVATGRPNSTEAVSNLTYVEIEEGGVTEVPITKWTLGDKAYSEKATINGTSNISVLKLGTSSVVGNATIVLPAGTVKVSYSAVAWNGKSGTVEFKNGSTTIVSQALKSNAGAANNTPYTMTTASTDNYEFNYSTDAETTITINTVSGKTRVIIWNIVAYVEN